MLTAITFYDVVVFVHVSAVVLAFGPTFGYAFFQATTERLNPRGVPTMWRATEAANKYLVTPLAIVLLVAGIYLVADRWDFSNAFVAVGLVAIIALLGLVHGFFNPRGRRALELAERDIEAAGAGEVVLSDEYWAASGQIARVGGMAGVIIIVTIFFMVLKP